MESIKLKLRLSQSKPKTVQTSLQRHIQAAQKLMISSNKNSTNCGLITSPTKHETCQIPAHIDQKQRNYKCLIAPIWGKMGEFDPPKSRNKYLMLILFS